MTSKFDEIEQQVMTEMRRIYSKKVIDNAMNPRNVGHIKNADGCARVTGSCGDTIEISIKVKKGKLSDAKFWTDGCGTSIACGSVATELIKDENITDALRIDSESILNALGGLPESDMHCAVLASDTLRAAIKDYFAGISTKRK